MPDRQPTVESIWHHNSPFQSPTHSPIGSPKGSPNVSPEASPTHSPAVDRKTKVKSNELQKSVPKQPKPYKGNSSLIKKKATVANDIENENNPETSLRTENYSSNEPLPPLPGRQTQIPRLPSRQPVPKPPENHRVFENSPHTKRKERVDGSSLKVKNIAKLNTRLSKSDENIERSPDCDFEEANRFSRRRNSITNSNKSNAKTYEQIFSADSYFCLENPTYSNTTSLEARQQENKPEFSQFPFPSSVSSNTNRPVPEPPVDGKKGDNAQRNAGTAENDIKANNSESDSETPLLPPKKNRVRRSSSASATVPDESDSSKVNLSRELSLPINNLSRDDLDLYQNSSPFDDDINRAMKFTSLDSPEGTKNDTQNGKNNDIYYPLPNEINVHAEVIPTSHGFIDDDDDDDDEELSPASLYESPMPLISKLSETPVVTRPFHNASTTPNSDKVLDPFADDPFFSSTSIKVKTQEQNLPPLPPNPENPPAPPVPPHRNSNSIVSRSAEEESTESISESESRLDSTIDPVTGQVIVAGPGRFFDSTQTRNDQKPMEFYKEDFELLMAQGYPPEQIKKALMVANNNFAIARNILKEFSPVTNPKNSP